MMKKLKDFINNEVKRPMTKKELLAFSVVMMVNAMILTKTTFILANPSGDSMLPNLSEGKTYVLTNKFIPRRGDVVYADITYQGEEEMYVKRIVGMPGEHIIIKDEKVFIDGELFEEDYVKDGVQATGYDNNDIVLGEDEYFLLGDNREISLDSRDIGPIKKDAFIYEVVSEAKNRQ